MDTGIFFSLLSAFFLAGNSTIGARWLKGNNLSAYQISFFSLLPAFLISIAFLPSIPAMNIWLIILLFSKNALYGMAFYLRFMAFSRCGMASGALLASSQPILVSILADIFLGESISTSALLALILVGGGIYCLISGSSKLSLSHIFKYLLLPAVLISVVTVIDRAVLRGALTGEHFFVIDKLVLLPAFIAAIALSNRLPFSEKIAMTLITKRLPMTSSVALLVAGILWLGSSFTYGLALDQAPAAIVTVIRSLSYPLVALFGYLLCQESLTKLRATGFALIVASILLMNLG